MGTLTDITSTARNKQLRSVDSPVPSRSGSHVKGNFMSPTITSSKKGHDSITSKEETRNSTPTSVKLEKASTAKWMTSAARRVGLRRIGGDGTPRSKKEGVRSSRNAVIFPDKLSTSSHSNMPDLSRPRPTPTSLFSEKPLPSPPAAQLMSVHLGEPRSLIDASEKPLQRTSPKSPSKQEEWPILFPEKPTTPDSIRESLQHTNPEPARLVSNDQERYPRLSGSRSVSYDQFQEPMVRLPSIVQIRRKELPSSTLVEDSLIDPSNSEPPKDGTDSTTQTTTKDSKLFPREPKNARRLSAGAAAVEKSSLESKSIKEPRQTRTSSLRARISAGQVIQDSPNKILGFTDFTAEKAPSAKPSKEDLNSAAGSRPRSSAALGKGFTKKPSKEFLGGSRAPAQFVAGSRRPVARRPSSRNSLRSDSRASSPTYMEASRPAPPLPLGKNDTSTRKSSIPVFRNSTSLTVEPSKPQKSPIEISTSTQALETTNVRDGHSEICEGMTEATIGMGQSGVVAAEDTDHAAVLESIEESPRSTIRSKRISNGSPTFGPMLKISSSADRLIMGTGESKKDTRPLLKKRSKDLFRAAVTNEHKNVNKDAMPTDQPKNKTSRPISNQELADKRQRPRNETAPSVPRASKVNSIDLGNSSAVSESKGEAKAEPSPGHLGDISKSRSSSATDDPFFDAVEQRKSQAEMDKRLENGVEIDEAVCSTEPEVSISSAKDSVTLVGGAPPVVPAFLPETLQHQLNNADGLSGFVRADEVKERKAGYSSHRVDTDNQQATNSTAPLTPIHNTGADAKTPLSTFPPRSSSRMQHPDYTLDESAQSSPISSLDRAAMGLQHKISTTDFAESQPQDIDSLSQPINNGATTSHRGLPLGSPGNVIATRKNTQAMQITLADAGSKRNSTARITHKSQSSVSKGLMSNFRGLFHKRTSDVSEAPSLRSNTKSSKRPTVNSHGSPFPSMSNIHPVYRPTQASINRNNATGQRTSGNSLMSTAPGTPTFNSPLPTEISTTTSLAMQILESARKENSSPKKERLLSLGKIMVDSITQARDAEKAMEEAKQAARKAEVAYVLCKKSVGDVANMVKEWRGDFEHS
ncbi:MAG: hypothetical protein Q9169_004869 [Polycauliona sp. 2 TL-2023]